MTILLGLIIVIVGFAVVATLVVFVAGPVMVLNPRRRGEEYYRFRGEPITPADLNIPYEEFFFLSAAGEPLNAWYLPAESPARGTVFYLHGVGDNKISGLRLAQVFRSRRFNVLLYDSRAHGRSEGKYCTYGYYEKFDVSKAIDSLGERQRGAPGRVGLFGTSMGAAVAVQAASIEPRIAAVVAEGCFTNLRTITVDYQKRLLWMPWHFLRNVAMKRSEMIAHFSHHDVSPLRALATVSVPIMFIHGKSDARIRYQYSEQLFAAAREPKELYLIDGANHTDIHNVAQREYEERVSGFFEKWLKP
ncbi:MAG TPA: alpha/beta fold hydrolase [Bacteroidota bacterium]|nr:alpha/beta fold hydrolase [Bacteroidota bacterium]